MKESIYQRAYSRAIEDGYSEEEAHAIAQCVLMDADDESGVFDIIVPDGEQVFIVGDE